MIIQLKKERNMDIPNAGTRGRRWRLGVAAKVRVP